MKATVGGEGEGLVSVTVVVPAYNAEKYLSETLKSVLAQTFADWEVVVVDDGSTDRTAVIAKEYEANDRRIRLVQQENRGLAGARNRGYEEASKDAKYFLFLDADDLLEPCAIESLLAGYARMPDAKAIFGLASFIDANGKPLAPSKLPAIVRVRWTFHHGKPTTLPWGSLADLPPSYQSLLYGCCIRTPGLVLISRQSLAESGIFDPTAHGVEDWDLWLRLSLKGTIGYTEEVVLRYRIHAQNMSSRLDFMRLGELKMRKKLLESPDLTREQRQQAEAALRFHYLGPDRLPVVEAARQVLDRASSMAGNDQVSASIASTPLEDMRRDLLVLVTLDCDAKLAEKVRNLGASDIPSFTDEEATRLSGAREKLTREQKGLVLREKLRALSLKWPFLPFRKAFRLLRHMYLVSIERLHSPKAGEER